MKLTEDMVISRTKTSELATVKKFNCWGSDLSDVSLVRKLLNVEVLSLSLNKITSLADFQQCKNLTELYVRRNEIRDLCELCYLQELPRLRRLLLAENPAVETAGPLYRATVLRCLPHLEVLDNQAVAPDEIETAMKQGLILEHPLQRRERTSPEPTYYERESPPPANNNNNNNIKGSRRSLSQYDYEEDSPPYRQPSQAPSHSPEQYQYQQHNGSGNKSPETITTTIPNGTTIPRTPTSALPALNNSMPLVEELRSSSPPTNVNSPGTVPMRKSSASPVDGYQHQYRENGSRRESVDYSPQNYDNYYDEQMSHHRQQVQQVQVMPTQRHPPIPPHHARTKPRTKTSNLLSAVLCLIPELDYGSLEVIELAVRRRMDEIINN